MKKNKIQHCMFVMYLTVRIPELIGVSCAMYVLITTLFSDFRSDWFNSLSTDQVMYLYVALTIIAALCAIIHGRSVDRYMQDMQHGSSNSESIVS